MTSSLKKTLDIPQVLKLTFVSKVSDSFLQVIYHKDSLIQIGPEEKGISGRMNNCVGEGGKN